MSSDSDPNEIIAKLKFIAKLNKGDKINVKNLYVQQNNFLDRVNRSFFNIDDRSNTLLFINHTIKHAFELFYTYIKEKEPFHQIQAKNVISDLQLVKKGLLHLKETYIDDIMFTCKIDTIIQENDAKLEEILQTYYK